MQCVSQTASFLSDHMYSLVVGCASIAVVKQETEEVLQVRSELEGSSYAAVNAGWSCHACCPWLLGASRAWPPM